MPIHLHETEDKTKIHMKMVEGRGIRDAVGRTRSRAGPPLQRERETWLHRPARHEKQSR